MPARKTTTNPTERLTVSLDRADRAELDKLSKEMDRSLGWLVRQAVHEYLSRMREQRQGKS